MIYYHLGPRSRFHLHPGKWIMLIFALALTLFLFTRCATPPIAVPEQPGFGVLGVSPDHQGFIISPTKRDYLVAQGVPAEWFTPSDTNFLISAEHETQAADILLKDRNP